MVPDIDKTKCLFIFYSKKGKPYKLVENGSTSQDTILTVGENRIDLAKRVPRESFKHIDDTGRFI